MSPLRLERKKANLKKKCDITFIIGFLWNSLGMCFFLSKYNEHLSQSWQYYNKFPSVMAPCTHALMLSHINDTSNAFTYTFSVNMYM